MSAVDIQDPMLLMAEMARRGLTFNQLLPYEDAERGQVHPLDDPEVQVEVRRFMAEVWHSADVVFKAARPPRSASTPSKGGGR